MEFKCNTNSLFAGENPWNPFEHPWGSPDHTLRDTVLNELFSEHKLSTLTHSLILFILLTNLITWIQALKQHNNPIAQSKNNPHTLTRRDLQKG